ncbi:hypothetical protein ABIB40_001553 [Pedobacter sp. UYP30]|uniref:ATP-dependent DNA helicase n=1 Tax=Pedobacter sp. UYP30 TaxID=1756400 RepID=UPI0033940807
MLFDFSENSEAQDVIHILEIMDDHVFLTGRAGTGKTSLLLQVMETTQKSFIALAPTAAAAINISGTTIHSFFQFGFGPLIPSVPISFTLSESKRIIINKLELLIIDEISMVRADLLDGIDRTLRFYRKSSLPFGGVQLLLVGDSFQLPPIVKEQDFEILEKIYSSLFFFKALVFSKCELLTIELLKVYRQQDPLFISILDSIRLNKLDNQMLSIINGRTVLKKNLPEDIITIATQKSKVQELNSEKLAKLASPLQSYLGHILGIFKNLPVLHNLELKRGAKVVLTKNDPSGRWVNGSIGTILDLGKDELSVLLEKGKVVSVERVSWTNTEYKYNKEEEKIIPIERGRFTQFPVALGWAITIHRSQGLSFDQIIVDLGNGTWDSGQAYVALSRCRNMDGLYLKRALTTDDIKLHNSVVKFSQGFNNEDVYRSSTKAKKITKLRLIQQVEQFKIVLAYKNITTHVDKIIKLPCDLLEKFSLLSLKGYCEYRSGDNAAGAKTLTEIEKYQNISQSFGSFSFDSIFEVLHGAYLLNTENKRRGAHKIRIQLNDTFPETLIVLRKIVFDEHTFNHINILKP